MFFVARTLDILINIYIWMIIIRAVISWVSPYSRIPGAMYLFRLTDPFLARIRRIFPTPRMAIDISPIIAILILELFRYIIVMALS